MYDTHHLVHCLSVAGASILIVSMVCYLAAFDRDPSPALNVLSGFAIKYLYDLAYKETRP